MELYSGGDPCALNEPGIGDKWEVDSEDSVTPHELSRLARTERRLIKLLDNIAETFAREKSVPPSQTKRHERRSSSTKGGRGASHVTASGLVMANREPTVYVAKNGGVDDADEDLARKLTIWIRAISATAERPAIDKDIMWMKLVDYYKQRLDIYASQIKSLPQADLTAAFPEGSDGVALARELHKLSVEYGTDRSLNTLQRMVSIAYRLRYEPTPDTLSIHSKRARRSACFLGRLRSAYETFKETAIELRRSFAKLTVVCLQAPDPRLLKRRSIERRIEELSRDNGIPMLKKGTSLESFGEKNEGFDSLPC